MQKDKLKQILIYVIPFIAFIIIFGFTSACGSGRSSTKEVSKPTEEEQEIIGYRETEDWGKVPVKEWKIGKPIDYPNGLRFILNKVWIEEQEGYPFVVINETLINKTDEMREVRKYEVLHQGSRHHP